MKYDPDSLIASAEKCLALFRNSEEMGITVDSARRVFFQKPDSKEWSRIVNLALASNVRLVSICDYERDGL